jgi:HPt (histidine-containing phosphotransfer) domain-containing protein
MNDFINASSGIIKELEYYPLINPANLEKLQKSTASNPEYLLDIFRSFLDDTSELMEEMEVSFAQRNFSSYYSAVHSLKGLAGTIGFSRLFYLLKVMDAHNKEEHFDQSAIYLPVLKKLFSEIKDYLNKDFTV